MQNIQKKQELYSSEDWSKLSTSWILHSVQNIFPYNECIALPLSLIFIFLNVYIKY